MIPLSLYIHIPWCIRKCPYCDFNSHKSPETLPEERYIQALIADLNTDLLHFNACARKIGSEITSHSAPILSSIFIGGGTPSLFSAQAYAVLFSKLKELLSFTPDIEITMEANPGSVEQQRFKDYRQLGINRLSLGIQSFNPKHLKALGRIHDDQQARLAIESARNAGFNNLNLDIMHGLPKQSIAEAMEDLRTALTYEPEHLSWYQLTIEPNTVFYKAPPPLPSEDDAWFMEQQGLALLKESGFERYEISAFAKPNKQAQHNLNYWLFGDYLGIGAGAHGKLTAANGIFRTFKYRQPKEYLDSNKPFLASMKSVDAQELIFEFMLNTTRLEQAIPIELFTKTTGLPLNLLLPKLKIAANKKLIHLTETYWQVTDLGRRYTNDLQAIYL